jgi:hypothetical protein
MMVTFDEIKDHLLLGLVQSKHQNIILLSEFGGTLHDGTECLKVTFDDSLLELIEAIGNYLIDEPLGEA